MNTHAGVAQYLIDVFGPRTAAPVFVTSLANNKDESGKYPPRQLISRDELTIAQFAEKWDIPKRALYFCVSTIKPGVGRRAKTTLAELTGLHVDIDFKNTAAAVDDILTALKQLALPPHRINHSGHGIHAYWLFEQAIEANNENIERLEAALRRLADLLAGDLSVCEVARLMRVPGSHNSKNGEWIEVINLVNRDGGYTLEQLEAWLTTATPVLARMNGEPVASGVDNPWLSFAEAQIIQTPIDVEARLAAMQFHGAGETAIHPTQLSVAAALLNRGTSVEDVVSRLLEATRRAAGSAEERWNWVREGHKIRQLCETWLKKHPEVLVEVEEDADELKEPESEPESESDANNGDTDNGGADNDSGPKPKLKLKPEPKPKFTKATNNPATAKRAEQGDAGVSLADFHAYLPTHEYYYAPTRQLWPAVTINSVIAPIPLVNKHGKPILDKRGKQKTITPSTWLDKNKSVQQMTWAPGFPTIIRDRLVADGGWIKRKGTAVFNLYRPPPDWPTGDPAKVRPWLDHAYKLFCRDDANHVIRWLAYRVQHSEIKINHCLVLGSEDQGIGKDMLLEPVKRGLGHWNFHEVSAKQALGRFNNFLKNIIVRISEVRDLGADRFAFYDHLKAYTAAPPDTMRIDEKFIGEYSVFNVVGIILTTNHKADGIYLPAEDRRNYVAWSDLRKTDFDKDYWNRLNRYYDNGGCRHVMTYLKQLDLSDFDPKAPPPQTEAFWAIANASRAPEEAEMADVLDRLKNPDATTLEFICDEAVGDFENWLRDRRNRRTIPYRLQACGYVQVRNPGRENGLWVVNGSRQVIYAKKNLGP